MRKIHSSQELLETAVGAQQVGLWSDFEPHQRRVTLFICLFQPSMNLDPSVELVGRVPTDPLGTMQGPNLAVTGTGVQQSSFQRWVDYSSMAIDPKDDCTFWYTQEYYKTSGSFNWATRIMAFKFNGCH